MITTVETLKQLTHGSAAIIYFSRYRADLVDNGGARRVAQMLQLLDRYDLEFVSSLSKPSPVGNRVAGGTGSLLDMALQAVVRGRYRKYAAEFAMWIFFSRRLARRWGRALARRDNVRLVIVDDPIFFAPLVHALHKRRIPVIAHCHNMETLSRGQVKEPHQRQLLLGELELLDLCQAAITISREETFLLRNLGIKAFHLSYYPPAAIERRLLAVRQLRMNTLKGDFLLLGSAGNPPTRRGMEQIMAIWENVSPHLPGDRLVVAGFGTEVLRTGGNGAGVVVAGAVTDEALDEILARVRATIVFQEDGAGALTRIAELLLAGIPVVANDHAARSYHHLPGLTEFADPAELPSLLSSFSSAHQDVIPPPMPDAESLVRHIDSVLGGRGWSVGVEQISPAAERNQT